MKDANRSKTNIESPSRRSFLRLGGACAALTATPVLSTLLNLQLTKTALAATSGFDDYKALVCVFLFGGNDSYNMLVPNEDLGYSEYAATRSNLALPRNDLLPITDPALDPGAFGIHPGMPEAEFLQSRDRLRGQRRQCLGSDPDLRDRQPAVPDVLRPAEEDPRRVPAGRDRRRS